METINNTTALQILNQLYTATRFAPLTADQHNQLQEIAVKLNTYLQEIGRMEKTSDGA